MKDLRVLLISVAPHNAVGGIATWTKGYLEYCKNNHILCDLIDTAKVNKLKCCKMMNEIVRTQSIILRLKKEIEYGDYDVVHLNSSIGFYGIIRDYFIARIIARRNIPIVLHFHCDIQYWDQSKLKHFFLRKIIKLVDECIVLNNSSKNYLYQIYNKRSIIMSNFIALVDIQNHKEIRENASKIIYIGRVSEIKGGIEILELAKHFPNKSFLLVGRNLLNLLKIDLPTNVNLLGEIQHSEVLELLDKADIFLFPSHSEGFSIALTEAMARGLPSIVTDVGANQDMVSGGAGIVVPVGDIEKMKSALIAMESQVVRQEMSTNALIKAKKEYSLNYVMNQFVLIYRRIIHNENK